MNERIQELKEQARDFYLDDEDYKRPLSELHRLVEEKFAELIVRECIEQFAFSVTDNTEIIQDRFTQCRKVAKYFGVEE